MITQTVLMKNETEQMEQAKEPAILKEGEILVAGYSVLEHLRRGKDCDVYHVWSEERLCGCIGKNLRPDRLEKRSARDRLIREGEYLQKLSHPNLVRAYEVYSDPNPVVIQETLTGQTLSHLIKTHRNRRLPLKQLAHLGIQLCSVIHYLHRHDVLHLDVKASNIISQPPLAKLIDLSIACTPGEIKKGAGTRQFMAPEQARGDRLTEAADVWGIGAVFYHAAAGKAPFKAYDDKRYDQLERQANRVRSHRRMPTDFANIIDQCLHPDPEKRPAVEELMKILKRFK